MSREADAALQLKILQVGFVCFFIAAVWFAVKSMMLGSQSKAGAIAAFFVGLAAVLFLDDRYWLLLPILAFANLAIPGLPFNGTELGCLSVTVVHALRIVLRRDARSVGPRLVVVVLPLLLWVAIMFMLNPVGLAMFGSRTIGGRFYFDIAIGFSAFLSLSSLRIGEKEARLLFYAILLSLLIAVIRGVVFPQADPDALVFSNTGLEQEVSVRYAFITCSILFMLLFSKWSIRQVLTSPIRLFVLFLLAVLTVYSGKRQAFGSIVLVPVLRMFLKGKDVLLTCAMGFLAAIVLIFAVVGDGMFFTLPTSAKRALAVVAPRYERETAGGIHDLFRRELRKEAYSLIGENPMFGRKGFAMNLENTRWMNFGGGYTSIYAGHAYSGNWHNMWLAYACDFGIPGLCFAVFLWFWLLRFVFRENRMISCGVYLPACFLFFSFELLIALVFSWVSGHASHSTYETLIRYGLLLALVNGYQASHPSCDRLSPLSNGSPAGQHLISAGVPASEGMP